MRNDTPAVLPQGGRPPRTPAALAEGGRPSRTPAYRLVRRPVRTIEPVVLDPAQRRSSTTTGGRCSCWPGRVPARRRRSSRPSSTGCTAGTGSDRVLVPHVQPQGRRRATGADHARLDRTVVRPARRPSTAMLLLAARRRRVRPQVRRTSRSLLGRRQRAEVRRMLRRRRPSTGVPTGPSGAGRGAPTRVRRRVRDSCSGPPNAGLDGPT